MNRDSLRGWPAALFGALLVWGLTRHETLTVLRNALNLCLSCMGLGK